MSCLCTFFLFFLLLHLNINIYGFVVLLWMFWSCAIFWLFWPNAVGWQERNIPPTSLFLLHRNFPPSAEQDLPRNLYMTDADPLWPCFPSWCHPSGRSNFIQLKTNYYSWGLILPLSQGKRLSRWRCVLDKCSAKIKHSDPGSGSSRAPSALNSIRRPRPRSSPVWTWGKWSSCQRERASTTGLLFMWWISLTGSTWSMARWVSSAQSAHVPSCPGGWGMSTGGRMVTTTRNPPSCLPSSTWTCWWTGSSRSLIMKTSSPPE